MEVTELVDKCDTSSEDVQLARQIVVKAKANNTSFFHFELIKVLDKGI